MSDDLNFESLFADRLKIESLRAGSVRQRDEKGKFTGEVTITHLWMVTLSIRGRFYGENVKFAIAIIHTEIAIKAIMGLTANFRKVYPDKMKYFDRGFYIPDQPVILADWDNLAGWHDPVKDAMRNVDFMYTPDKVRLTWETKHTHYDILAKTPYVSATYQFADANSYAPKLIELKSAIMTVLDTVGNLHQDKMIDDFLRIARMRKYTREDDKAKVIEESRQARENGWGASGMIVSQGFE